MWQVGGQVLHKQTQGHGSPEEQTLQVQCLWEAVQPKWEQELAREECSQFSEILQQEYCHGT